MSTTASSSRGLIVRLFILAMALLLVPAILFSLYALREFRHEMLPEMDKKAVAVSRALSAQFNRALALGIPLPRVVGAKAVLEPVLRSNSEIAYVAVTDTNGRLLLHVGHGADSERLRAAVGGRTIEQSQLGAAPVTIHAGPYSDTSVPIGTNRRVAGYLHVGIDENIVRERIQDIMYDVAIVVVVSALVAFEVLLFLVARSISGPIAQVDQIIRRIRAGDLTHTVAANSWDEIGRVLRAFNGVIARLDESHRRLARYIQEIQLFHYDRRVAERAGEIEAGLTARFKFHAQRPAEMVLRGLVDVRTPLFIFVFAEELSRSFMPLYVRDLYVPIPGLSLGVVIGLPITVYMVFVAVFSPWGGQLTDRLGSRKVFLLGLVPSLAGFLLSGLAANIYDFMVWRAVTAMGYAVTTMACQGYIASVTTAENRSQGMNVFVGAVLAAAICGASIGGVLADRLGYDGVFYVSCALVVVSGLFVYHFLKDGERPKVPRPKVGLREIGRAMGNPRFAALIVFSAIPAKIALTGFQYYLAPLYLDSIGASSSTIGRLMMAYGIAVVMVGPLAALAADRYGWRLHLVAAGGVLAGLGMLGVMVSANQSAILAATLVLGIAHGLSSSPMLASVPDLCAEECATLGQTTMMAIVRLLERVGSALGPILGGVLIPLLGYGGAVVGLGILVMIAGLAFAVLMPRLLGHVRKAEVPA